MNLGIEKLDTILAPYLEVIGEDIGYVNHTKRMLTYANALYEFKEDEEEKFVIALAFHDLGIWTENSFDYLDPSVALAKAYLKEHGLEAYEADVVQLIDEHHKLMPIKNNPLAELFRRVDMIDVYWNLSLFGMKASTFKAAKKAYPNNGFHVTLIKWFFRQLRREPLRPMPMLKW